MVVVTSKLQKTRGFYFLSNAGQDNSRQMEKPSLSLKVEEIVIAVIAVSPTAYTDYY